VPTFPLTEVTRLADRYMLYYIRDNGAFAKATISKADHDIVHRGRVAAQVTPKLKRGEKTRTDVRLDWQRAIVDSQTVMDDATLAKEITMSDDIIEREKPTPKQQWQLQAILTGVLTFNIPSQSFEPQNISVETDNIRVWTPKEDTGDLLPITQFTVIRGGGNEITLSPQPLGYSVINGELIWA